MTRIPDTEDRLSSQAEGIWVGDRYINRSEVHQCVRCGLWRRISADRATTDLCKDCKMSERPAKPITRWLAKQPIEAPEGIPVKDRAGIVRWVKPARIQRMSDEDMAWCERAATAWFWTDWERQNRQAGANPRAQHNAEKLARALSTGAADWPSTSAVDNGLSDKAGRMFDERNPRTEKVAS